MRLFESSTYDGIPYEELAEIKNLRKTTPGLYAEQDAVDHIFSEADETTGFGNLPLIVLSAGRLPGGLPAEITAEVLSRFLRVREELQTDLVALSIKSEQRTCAGTIFTTRVRMPSSKQFLMFWRPLGSPADKNN
jgi:hypothetical protein